MLDRQTQKLMQEEAKFFGISNGLKQYSPFPFAGMNQQSSRQGMEENEFFWRENFIKTGPGALRTLWDKGNPIYVAPNGKTIIYFFFYNIGSTNYVAVFLNDGTAVQVNARSGAQTVISSVTNTFYNTAVSTQIPVCGQWGSQYLLIANNITANSYWVWDGLVLYTSGSLGPAVTLISGGSGYSSAPAVIAVGGSGSGATFTASVSNGSVVSVQTLTPGSGYKPGEIVQLIFSGGGSDNGAILTAVLSAVTVGHITLLSPGSGYTSPVVAITGGGGSGATATATQIGGAITSITLTNPGSGYTSTPAVAITDGGPGAGATAVVILNPGSISSVTVANGGSGFTATPALTVVGGGGSGATLVASLTAGAISSVSVSAPGTGYTSTPAVEVGAGLNNAAQGLATLMPFGVSGTSIETYQQRVWLPYPHQNGVLSTGGVFSVSAPGSFTDFATSDGGLSFTNSDAFLRQQYTNIKQSNGYLYPFGDSSVSVISNVQTTGAPATTSFNYQNTDPQTGTSWRDSLQAYSRTVVFANAFGVFGLYGGAVAKISSKMDSVFNTAIFPPDSRAVTPTSAVANLFNMKAYFINMTITDPFTQTLRTVMLGWDEKEWFIASQSSTFTFIGTQEINSNMFAWGTDGTSLYPLFNTASTVLQKKLSTKLYGQNNFLIQKESLGVYVQAQDLSVDMAGVTFQSIQVDAEHGSYFVPSIPAFPKAVPPYYPVVSIGSGDVTGVNLGLTLVTAAEDFVLNFLGLGYIDVSSIAMASTPIAGQISTE